MIPVWILVFCTRFWLLSWRSHITPKKAHHFVEYLHNFIPAYSSVVKLEYTIVPPYTPDVKLVLQPISWPPFHGVAIPEGTRLDSCHDFQDHLFSFGRSWSSRSNSSTNLILSQVSMSVVAINSKAYTQFRRGIRSHTSTRARRFCMYVTLGQETCPLAYTLH